ncbi:BgTH12-06537 [Blumeria graminis f. sp. triticale]|uniref:BgTH12-06537 n=4 Tax=Blumeria graminis TaxID=34373 RepID=A0A9W4CYR8_BLUGR|nr:BgTH12-06537 [Blumeria graminis f. sp. triticale]
MWDVAWTDPDRETVRQRRFRKDPKAPSSRHLGYLSRRTSILGFNSRDRHHAKPSFFGLFIGGGFSNRRRKKSDLKESSVSKLSPVNPNQRCKEASQWANDLRENPPGSPIGPPESSNTAPSDQCSVDAQTDVHYYSDTERNSDLAESIFSERTGRSAKTHSTWSAGADPNCPQKGHPNLGLAPVTLRNHRNIAGKEKRVEKVCSSEKPSESTETVNQVSSPIKTISFTCNNTDSHEEVSKTLEKQELSKIKLPQRSHRRVTEGWKPPDAWACLSDEEFKALKTKSLARPAKNHTNQPPSKQAPSTVFELSYLQRSIRRMEAASPKIVLERLKEEWNEIADASVYRELELERQLWMLTALRGLRKPVRQDHFDTGFLGAQKVLSLYENHASASTLSAITTAIEVYHYSTMPLSPKNYPNVHPHVVDNSISRLPFPSNKFTSISAFSMTSYLPASSIPAILKECHRILVSSTRPSSPTLPAGDDAEIGTEKPQLTRGGSLHLTVLDPAPIPATAGPRLKTWLDTHLILNLERQFRCIHPSRLFPVWLADAGLHAEESAIAYTRFFASVTPSIPTPHLPMEDSKTPQDEEEPLDEIKLELKCIVGRMLWKEIWGGFVQAQKWWWEEEEILEECERLGTCWEYAVIEAVKED